jgi:hypothetical protein
VKAFKASLETGDLATTKKHLSDTGGGEDTTDKDRKILELEAEVARLKDREK